MNEIAEHAWRKALLPIKATIQDAIRNLDDSALQIILVISPEGTLLGTITDGDIRRGLLRGLNLDSPIDTVINHEAFVVPPQISRDLVLNLMRANKILQLPIVDNNQQVVGLHLWDKVGSSPRRPNTMVIMAGGIGKRMRPHTENCPKPLLPVAGKPILEHIVNRAKIEGFSNFIFAIHYLGHMITDYFSHGERWQVHIDYLHEDIPLGTAGALSLLNPKPDLPFVISNGDVLTDIRYGELLDFHCNHNATGTMAVRQYEWQNPFGVVQTKGIDIVGFEEKPIIRSHVNAGVYVLNPSALDLLQQRERCDMPMLFERLQKSANLRTIAYPMHEPWLDVGKPTDLEHAQATILA